MTFFLIIMILLYVLIVNAATKYLRRKHKITIEENNARLGGYKIGVFVAVIKKYLEGLLWYQSYLIGLFPGHILRRILYVNLLGMRVGHNSFIYGRSEIIAPWKIELGENSIIGISNTIDGRLGIVIGNNVNISHHVKIWTMQHDPLSDSFDTSGGPVIIEDNAWISSDVIILPNVRIGRNAVVAAGAVVTKDVESYSICAGVPAKKIATRTNDISYTINKNGPIPFI
jgi:acetyltransferase-like isoleucine patch superfamily enzyme